MDPSELATDSADSAVRTAAPALVYPCDLLDTNSHSLLATLQVSGRWSAVALSVRTTTSNSERVKTGKLSVRVCLIFFILILAVVRKVDISWQNILES